MAFLEKLKNIPSHVRVFFSSNEPRLELERACFLFQLDDEKIGKLSGPVGLISVGEIELQKLPEIILGEFALPSEITYGIAYEINKRIFNIFPEYFKDAPALLAQWEKQKAAPLISEDEAWKKVLENEPWIALEQQAKSEMQDQAVADQKKIQDSLKSMPILDAIKQFPEINEQLLTSDRIESKAQHGQVRPTIGNWIADYRSVMGFGHHDGIARGNYLFQSINGRKLSASDRQKVAHILRAYDEHIPITVNVASKQLVILNAKEDGSENSSPTPLPSRPSFAKTTDLRNDKIEIRPKAEPVEAPSPPQGILKPSFRTASKTPVWDAPKIQNEPLKEHVPNPFSIDYNNPAVIKKAATAASAYKELERPERPKNSMPAVKLHGSGNIRFSSPQTLPFEKTGQKGDNNDMEQMRNSQTINLKKE